MKNLKTSIFFLLIIYISYSQNNNGQITYKKSFEKNFSELNQKLKSQDLQRFIEYNEIWVNGSDLLKNIEFILKFNDIESSFKINNYVEHEVDELDLNFALGIYANSVYYNNLMNNVYYRQTDSYGEKFIIEMPKINWKLVDLSKNINGYLCFKAVSKTNTMGRNGDIEREVIAWYTSEVSIPFGPIGFTGLPGLIIKLVYDNEVYIVSEIDLNPIKKVIIKKPNKGIKVTKIEFEKIGLDKMSNFKKMF